MATSLHNSAAGCKCRTQSASASASAGKLLVYPGPVQSGKTSVLIERFETNQVANVPTLLIKNKKDVERHGTFLTTHGGRRANQECVCVEKLSEVKVDSSIREILIDELSLFDDKDDVEAFITSHLPQCTIVVALIDLTWEKKFFSNGIFEMLLTLPPDKVHYKRGVCFDCKRRNGTLSYRVDTKDANEVRVGGVQEYLCVCRAHYRLRTGRLRTALAEPTSTATPTA